MKILTVLGSLQRRSANRALLELAAAHAPSGAAIVPALSLGRIPHYNADRDADPAPAAVAEWRRQLQAADAVLIASPEYGHGVAGVLKNAIDWIVGSGEFAGKPVAATCAAQGPGRGLLGLAALVQTLRAVDARVVWSDPVIVPRASLDAQGPIDDATAVAAVRSLLTALAGGVDSR